MSYTKPKSPTIESQVADVIALDLESLRADWRRRWGEPPNYRSRELLARAIAHKLQTEAFGDLPASAQRHMSDLAQRFMADRGFTPQAATTLLPGSSLIREWQGKRHEVAVVADGLVYQGEKFRSLSQVASHITGTKWNGPVFFGLRR
jgi:Protein of unknown function (DUF2924)